ncbi:hypothetical protein V5O48_011589 [Marasmius crinis-equi]|uniref:Uncharacterized protein n=1 Tax=Marasmius crinis-equi TaxID=585013 RepID=A0ABR3F5F5_9AGAR
MSDLDQEKIAQIAASLTVGTVIVYPVVSILFTYFFYGLYIPIFSACVHLLRKGGFEARKLYVICTILMFVISTILVVDFTALTTLLAMRQFKAVETGDYASYQRYLYQNAGKAAMASIYYFMLPFANLAAETMLIHRCYLVWGNNRKVGIPLYAASILGSVLTLVAAIIMSVGISRDASIETNAMFVNVVGEQVELASLILNTIINTAVTVLTAGRIWWVERQSRAYGGPFEEDILRYAIRMIIESGIIYPLFMFIHLLIANAGDDPINFYPSAILAAAIAPSLIIVRAQVSKALDKLRSGKAFGGVGGGGSGAISNIRFGTRPDSSMLRGDSLLASIMIPPKDLEAKIADEKADVAEPLLAIDDSPIEEKVPVEPEVGDVETGPKRTG